MSSLSFVASSSSTSVPESRPKPSKSTRKKPNFWLPLSPFPDTSFEDAFEYAPNSPPGLTYHSPTARSAFEEPEMKSVFEDWDDSPIDFGTVVLDQDGVQTVLISPQNSYYHPLSAAKPFQYEPFSLAFPERSPEARRDSILNEVPTSATQPTSPFFDQEEEEDPDLQELIVHSSDEDRDDDTPTPTKSRVPQLFINTSVVSQRPSSFSSLEHSFTLSALIFSPEEHPLVDFKLFVQRPDVPSDLDIYSSAEYSATEKWDETAWSPITLLATTQH